MTDPNDRAEEIRRRWEAATPGPWYADVIRDAGTETWVIPGALRWNGYTSGLCCDEDRGTAEAIAAAPDDVAWLLAELDRRMQAEADQWGDNHG